MSDTEEKPDPSEVEPLTKQEAQYQRDEDGELIPFDKVIKTDDGWRSISILPTPKGEAMALEKRFGGRADLEMEDLDDLMDEKVVEPDIDDWDDLKPGVYMPMMEAVMESIMDEVPNTDFHAEVREEIEKRANEEEGN